MRFFYLSSWSRPLLFREPAELQTPMQASTPPAPLFQTTVTLSWYRGAAATPPPLTLLPVERAVVASAEEAESSAISSCACSPYRREHPIGERCWSRCVDRRPCLNRLFYILTLMWSPLCGLPHRQGVSPPRGLIAGSREGKKNFRYFFTIVFLHIPLP